MYARILNFDVKLEKKQDFVKVMKNEILPILRKQVGFLEILPFFPEKTEEKVVTISCWTNKADAEKYEKETYPKVYDILKPYLTTTPVTVKWYYVETALCEHFVEALAA